LADAFNTFLLLNVIFIGAFMYFRGSNHTEITWEEFVRDYLNEGIVDKLEVTDKRFVRVIPKSSSKSGGSPTFTIGSVDSFERKLDQAQRRLGTDSHKFVPVVYHQDSLVSQVISAFAPTLLFILGIMYLSRRMGGASGESGLGGLFSAGKSKAKFINPELVNVKFADVAGMDEAKEEIMEFVNFLKNPKMYKELGAKIPKGALLTGPPGTGKTLLAKV
jgi:AFG3 family protein